MFIILKGNVAVVSQHKRIGELGQHQFFGENTVLKPQRMGSYGQLHTRTHFAVDEEVQLASLGHDDLQVLREERPEINDAVTPFIREAMTRKVHQTHWFYITIDGAAGLRAADSGSMEAAATSDPYCVMKFRQDGREAHLIGKTDVENDTLDPAWATSFAFTRAEAKSYGETATFRFEVYDRDLEGADLLGVAECTLGDLCAEGETFDDFHVSLQPLRRCV